MPRILRNLRIDEVSLVDKGAGKGCAIVIRKRADAEEVGDTGAERRRRAKRAGRFTDILLGKKSAYEASLEREAELQAAVRKTGMAREELQAERDAQLRAIVKAHGITALAKGVVAGLTSIDEHELTALATEDAQVPIPIYHRHRHSRKSIRRMQRSERQSRSPRRQRRQDILTCSPWSSAAMQRST
jgi:hypothetical protein